MYATHESGAKKKATFSSVLSRSKRDEEKKTWVGSVTAASLCCAGDRKGGDTAFTRLRSAYLFWMLSMMRWNAYVCGEQLKDAENMKLKWMR